MKHLWKTRATALMFSAAAIGAGMLSVSCSFNSYNVYGPPPVSETDETSELPQTDSAGSEESGLTDAPFDLDAMTDDDFRHITDEQLIAMGRQIETMRSPAFFGYSEESDDYGKTQVVFAEKSVNTFDEAKALAEEMAPGKQMQNLGSEDDVGVGWYFKAGDESDPDVLVWHPSFLDMETQTLRAEVSERTMMLLAAMRTIPGERVVGAFVKDEGDQLTCTEYYLIYSTGDYGLSDTATLYGFTFSADKTTGQMTGYVSDEYDFSKEVEIPDTYHPDPAAG